MEGALLQAVVYLAAAVLAVPLAHRLGLGSVLGYLLAGIAIGPFGLHLVGHEGHDVMHFAEFGVVMMLFLVGLELQPARLWALRRSIFGLGTAQVVGTTLAVAGVAVTLGLGWKAALAIGMTLAMSSTAIVLQSLTEKGMQRSAGGEASFAVLLFQDLAVIPILALLPLLGAVSATADAATASRSGWVEALSILGAVIGVVGMGRYLVRPAFRVLARVRIRELFTAASLLIVAGIALLMQLVGLSPALGTFLAGVVLAESEYRHELEADIEPFKGLLLGLFFISVGAQIDFAVVAAAPGATLGLVVGIVTLKLVVLWMIGRALGLDRGARWLLAFALAQVGEFAFVLLAFSTRVGALDELTASRLVAVVALSMAVTPLLFMVLERWVLPRVAERSDAREPDAIAPDEHGVVIAGFGRFGQVVGRVLRTAGVRATVLDLDPDMLDILRRLGLEVHYGDAARPDLLEAAGCARARLFVLAIDEVATSVAVARHVRQAYPTLPIVARARNRSHYIELRRLGVQHVYRETLGSAIEASAAALEHLGHRRYAAQRLLQRWRSHDEETLEAQLALDPGAMDASLALARRSLADAERLMRDEDPKVLHERDAAWNNESLREEASRRS